MDLGSEDLAKDGEVIGTDDAREQQGAAADAGGRSCGHEPRE
jgi:hypothetical protein